MSQIIIGLVGPIASGKGVFADHLKDLNFKVFSLSDKVREEAKSRGLDLIRENLQNVGDDLRLHWGNQILAERTAFDMIGEEGNLVIDSIRNPGEIDYLRNFCSIKIIGVDAPLEKRMLWYMERAKQRGEDKPDMAAFEESSLRDRGDDQPSNGQHVDLCLQKSDVYFYNSGTKTDILTELDLYLKKEFSFDPEIHRAGKEK